MVRMHHNRGATVNPFGPGQLIEIYQVRRILEEEAARVACGRIDPETLGKIDAELTKLAKDNGRDEHWSERAMASDRRLHEAIAAASGSQRLSAEIHRYNTLVQGVREVVGNPYKVQVRALEDHRRIVAALRAGDADAAAAAMAQHIRNSADTARQTMFSESPGEGRPS